MEINTKIWFGPRNNVHNSYVHVCGKLCDYGNNCRHIIGRPVLDQLKGNDYLVRIGVRQSPAKILK